MLLIFLTQNSALSELQSDTGSDTQLEIRGYLNKSYLFSTSALTSL